MAPLTVMLSMIANDMPIRFCASIATRNGLSEKGTIDTQWPDSPGRGEHASVLLLNTTFIVSASNVMMRTRAAACSQ